MPVWWVYTRKKSSIFRAEQSARAAVATMAEQKEEKSVITTGLFINRKAEEQDVTALLKMYDNRPLGNAM